MSSETPRTATGEWKWRRREVIIRDEYTCQDCGDRGGPEGDANLEVHHITPVEEGGTDNCDNLETLCSNCHDEIHGKVSDRILIKSFEQADVPAYYHYDLARKLNRSKSTIQRRLSSLVDRGVLDGSKHGVYFASPVSEESIKKVYPKNDILVDGRPIEDGVFVGDGSQYFVCSSCGGAYTTRRESQDIAAVEKRHSENCSS
jgi:hypothetical protein